MIIALTNSKGGVGKSTLAVHLTVWWQEQGAQVALVDADAQGSSSVWLHEAAPDLPVLRLQTADDILEGLPKLQTQFEHLIVDGPGGLSEVTRHFTGGGFGVIAVRPIHAGFARRQRRDPRGETGAGHPAWSAASGVGAE